MHYVERKKKVTELYEVSKIKDTNWAPIASLIFFATKGMKGKL